MLRQRKSKFIAALGGLVCACMLIGGTAMAAESQEFPTEGNGESTQAQPRISQNYDFQVTPSWRPVTRDNNVSESPTRAVRLLGISPQMRRVKAPSAEGYEFLLTGAVPYWAGA